MDTGPRIHEVFLKPGEWFVGDARWRIRTLLGSCVSMTLWHRQRRVGAMSHFLLSTRAGSPALPPDARYGDEALQLMLRGLAKHGIEPAECEAKIFGGGNMFPGQSRDGTRMVGEANGHAARALLRDHGIAVRSECLFGIGHRKVVFDVASGHVWSRQIAPAVAAGALREAS